MEVYLNKAIELAGYLPWYFYVGCLVLLIFFNRNVKEWEYHAKLFGDDKEKIIGHIDLKKYKKSYPQIEISVGALGIFAGKTLEVLINERVMAKVMVSTEVEAIKQVVPAANKDISIRSKDKKINKLRFVLLPYFVPKNNDKIIVKVNMIPAYEGLLFRA